ncbi:hypothetical protein ACWE42_15125 [Sutcliffiella cohnii]
MSCTHFLTLLLTNVHGLGTGIMYYINLEIANTFVFFTTYLLMISEVRNKAVATSL